MSDDVFELTVAVLPDGQVAVLEAPGEYAGPAILDPGAIHGLSNEAGVYMLTARWRGPRLLVFGYEACQVVPVGEVVCVPIPADA